MKSSVIAVESTAQEASDSAMSEDNAVATDSNAHRGSEGLHTDGELHGEL